jgi:hypothetical protein
MLQTSYAKLCSIKVVTNGVLYNLVNFDNFWVCGLKTVKKRILSAAVKNYRLNGRFLASGLRAL